MSLNQKWMRSAGAIDATNDPGLEPFADNTTEAITPKTLRNFSYEVDQTISSIVALYEARIAALEAQVGALTP